MAGLLTDEPRRGIGPVPLDEPVSLATVTMSVSHRSWLIALGWIVALLTIAIVGFGGGSGPAAASTNAPPAAVRGSARPNEAGTPAVGAAVANPMSFSVAAAGRRLNVSGALFIDADLVAVTVETPDGRTARWELLGVRRPPDSSGASPAPTFLAQFELPAGLEPAALWIRVDAYNTAGANLATVRRPVVADLLPVSPLGPWRPLTLVY